MAKATLTDGQFLTLTVGRFAGDAHRLGAPGRTLSARVDLSDDRSFLSNHHQDLVDMVPDLSINRGEAAGQGWIWIGAEQSSCEIHVVLGRLPPSIDLILGRCALELIDGACVMPVPSPQAGPVADEDTGNVIDLNAVRDARSGPEE